ncbi:flagellar hook-associated protein FlgK [Ahrensia sp. R2A130]|uniref:flagellar hook-associated protein FlgK n=1 Tax=Ahrensia sp. R2A130 TaxID=744979 RepID=UPI0001E0F86B|nr:flagellar hook-associated protein FlgK [Ahrensia sp. R2A130]EFL89482.1 flagellar hook-associated protein FlgK [Ahrensia sp. R2A130]
MSLTQALGSAQNSLLNISRGTSTVARNISRSDDANYVRRELSNIAGANRAPQTITSRAQLDAQLTRTQIDALSRSAGQEVIAGQLDRMAIAINGIDGESSPLAGLTRLQNSLQVWAARPSDETLGGAAVDSARTLVRGLNRAQQAVGEARLSIDRLAQDDVASLNGLLQRFKATERAIAGNDDTSLTAEKAMDAMDERDNLIRQIAQIVPVTSIARSDRSTMLVTSNGATIFDDTARTVSLSLPVGSQQSRVLVDGVPLPAAQGSDTDARGSLSGYLQLRDGALADQERQLDAIAGQLISQFAETDLSGGGAPPAVGLFTWSGAPAVPGATAIGTARSIAIDPAFEANPNLLRDGGANGASTVANTSGGASFSDLLNQRIDALETPAAIGSATQISGTLTISQFASQSIGWLDGARSTASRAADEKSALATRLSENLSNEGGVNIDEEMTRLLQLERAYEASARIVSTVDRLFDTLLASIR